MNNKNMKAPMKYDPATRTVYPWPSDPKSWRVFNGKTAWLFNPWSGEHRNAKDVGSDPFGELCAAPSIEFLEYEDTIPKRKM